VQAFEPYVSIALQKGYGRILYAASTRGPTAYTSLIATRDGLEHKADGMRAMTRAIRSMQTWMLTHDPSELAAVVAPYFPHIDASLLDTSIRRYAKAGIWAKEPELSREGFMQLARSVHSGGFVPALCAYEDCVAAL
jgi:NitT/TauT family transport system substrate-binding protein